MPGIHKRRDTWVSTSTGYEQDDVPSKKYCLKCEGFGYPFQPLSERLYRKEELINGQLPNDHDKWLQCYRCGALVPVQHGRGEGVIKGFIDIATPGDSLEPMIEPFIKPRKRKQTHYDSKKTNALPEIEQDKDVQRATSGAGSELRGYSDT